MTYLKRKDAIQYIRSKGVSLAPSTLISLAMRNKGPKYYYAGKEAMYSVTDIDEWIPRANQEMRPNKRREIDRRMPAAE